MAELQTPPATIAILAQNQFPFWRSCNCGGAYKEKFKRRDGTMIVITPGKGVFKVHGQPIFGPLDQLETKLQDIQ